MYVNERFTLDEAIIEAIYGQKPNFGYDGFGEFIFYRTYSRIRKDGGQESWSDVVRRVTEGTFSIRKDWYIRNHINWDEDFWQHYALHFALAFFNMEWLPPGRGAWAMGTDFVYERGSMALQNCGLIHLGDNLGVDVDWLMDAMMCGVGVGFLPLRNDDIKVYNPKGLFEFVIPDTREGWCQATKILINSYLKPGFNKVKLIYDEIRPAGLPIKGFGGISSGPEPLVYFHEKVRQFIDMYGSHSWYDSILLKTDIANTAGCCIVSGNVRRSAELCAGDIDDIMHLKNYDLYPYREAHGWMSNNSVFLREDIDFERLGEIAERIKTNGEPGYINLRNLPLGRIGKSMEGLRYDKATGFNPCITGETKVLTADGRGYVPIKELSDLGQDLDVFCISDDDQLVVRKMRHPRKTGEQVRILKVFFDDGSYIRCTENHKILLRNGKYQEARNLDYGDSVALVNRYSSQPGLTRVQNHGYIYLQYRYDNNGEHRVIAERHYGPLSSNDEVHHIDFDRSNNAPDNLEVLGRFEHQNFHSAGSKNPRFSGYSRENLIDYGVRLCLKLNRRFSSKEWKAQRICDVNSKHRRSEFGSDLSFAIMCADLAGVLNELIDPRTLKLYNDLVSQDYDCEIVGKQIMVTKECEYCSQPFTVTANRREQGRCSFSCFNLVRDYTSNHEGQKRTFDLKREIVRESQLNIYTRLKQELSYRPMRKEWVAACKAERLSSSIGRKGSAFNSWEELQEAGSNHNHRIEQILFDGYADVYNGTVDEFHNFVTLVGEELVKTQKVERGVVNRNCGEQPLEDKELCTLAITCPTRCATYEKWLKACEYATMYASTVTLLPTHRPETNAVMSRNRRIGVDITDVSGWQADIGTTHLIKNLREGYTKVRATNSWLNNEAGIPESIRVTTIKPNGTFAKVPGVRSGWSWPTFGYTLRRVRIAQNSSVCQILIDAGVPHEPDIFSANTEVFEWPIDQSNDGKVKSATEISLWQQAMMLVLLQREWADNAVSNTLYFKPEWQQIASTNLGPDLYVCDIPDVDWPKLLDEQEYEDDKGLKVRLMQEKWSNDWLVKIYERNPNHEENDIEPVLAAIAPLTKSVSVLPHTAKGVYAQTPEEGISKAEYERRLAAMKTIDWSELSNSDGQDEKYCDGASCTINLG